MAAVLQVAMVIVLIIAVIITVVGTADAGALSGRKDTLDNPTFSATSKHTFQFTIATQLLDGGNPDMSFKFLFPTNGAGSDPFTIPAFVAADASVTCTSCGGTTFTVTDVIEAAEEGADNDSVLVVVNASQNLPAGSVVTVVLGTGSTKITNPPDNATGCTTFATPNADICKITIQTSESTANPITMVDSGDVLVALLPGVGVVVNIAETMIFSIGSVSSADCDTDFGNRVDATVTATSIDYGTIPSTNTFLHGCHDLTINANASAGYFVTAEENRSLATSPAASGFPVVDATSSNADSTAATVTVTLPSASIQNGDLVVVANAQTGWPSSGATWPSPWVELYDVDLGGFPGDRSTGGYLIASGGETSVDVTFVAGGGEAAALVYVISNWHGTSAPESATVIGAGSFPDPPSLTPSWGAADTLWLAVAHLTAHTPPPGITGYPASYTNGFSQRSSTNGSEVGSARRERNVASEDPGTFTLGSDHGWLAVTIAVRPASGGAISTIDDTLCDGGTCSETTSDDWAAATNNGFGLSCVNKQGTPCDTGYTTAAGICNTPPCYRQFSCQGAGSVCDPGTGGEPNRTTVMTGTSPVMNAISRVEYRLSIGALQETGTYTNSITYVATVTY